MSGVKHDHVAFPDIDALARQGALDVVDGDDVSALQPVDALVGGDVEQDTAGEEHPDVLDAEPLQAIGVPEVGQLVAVVKDLVVAYLHADVAEAVELRTHLPDLGAHDFVVADDLVIGERLVRGQTGDGDAVMPLARHRHAVLVDPPQLVNLAFPDQ